MERCHATDWMSFVEFSVKSRTSLSHKGTDINTRKQIRVNERMQAQYMDHAVLATK